MLQSKYFDLEFLSDRIAELKLRPDILISETVADEVDKVLRSNDSSLSYKILCGVTGLSMIEPSLRKALANRPEVRPVSAVAVYTDDEKMNQVQEVMNTIAKMQLPIKYFANRDEALAWLRSLK